jgi:hypothetical protein
MPADHAPYARSTTRLRTHAGFRLFLTASTVSDFGSQVTTLAIQVRIVTTLAGSATDLGAPLGGLLADSAGFRFALWVAAVGSLSPPWRRWPHRFARRAPPDSPAAPHSRPPSLGVTGRCH